MAASRSNAPFPCRITQRRCRKIGDRACNGKWPASGKKPVWLGVSDDVTDTANSLQAVCKMACDVDKLNCLCRIVVSRIIQVLDEQALNPIDIGEQAVLLTAFPHPLHAQFQRRQRRAQIMTNAPEHAGACFDH
ncbi:hypothetical protein [Rhizobium leguminosarum]|uniref:hypothetical protein n=1 Tax=Rhizobium leguminosarum TaxID=384 RepID=UPI001C972C60|nr:hypothetical protein [Rhizobium leguminosarum]